MATQAKTGFKRWIVPAVTIVVALALAIVVLTMGGKKDGTTTGETTPPQDGTNEPTAEATPTEQGQTPDAGGNTQTAPPTEIIEPQSPMLTHTERRDPGDPLAYGPVDAPVGLVIFSDYQCPFCARWNNDTLPLLKEKADAGQLRIEWRDVNVFGDDSRRAALAAFAAGMQGKFWEYHNELFADGNIRGGGGLSEDALTQLAEQIGLDVAKWQEDFASNHVDAEIGRNERLGQELGAFSTPSFIMGGTPIVGAQPTQVFLDAFDTALAAAGG